MAKITLTKLIYSYSQNDLAHVETESETTIPSGYVAITEKMDAKDALKFINQMHSKYVKGRVSGRFPSYDIIMLELELFMALKDYHRKLV